MAYVPLKYIMRDVTRHGKKRVFVRIKTKKIRLLNVEGTEAFMREYMEAVRQLKENTPRPALRQGVVIGALEWIGNEYFRSSEFRALNEISQRTRKSVLQGCFAEVAPNGVKCGAYPARDLTAHHVRYLRDARQEAPGAANNRLKYLSAMFSWAVEAGHMLANVTRDVRPLKYEKAGFHTWTPEEVGKFEAAWPVGTKARLAMALMLLTGCRPGDSVKLGPSDIADSVLTFTPHKTARSSGAVVVIPILDELADIIEASAIGETTFLANAKGKPISVNVLGNEFAKWADKADVPHCTPHGLRKAGATIAAERGATDRELMAIFGWTSSAQATNYTKAADKKRLGKRAGALLGRAGTEQETAPPMKPLTAPPDPKDRENKEKK